MNPAGFDAGDEPLLSIPRDEFAEFHHSTTRALHGYLVRVTGSQSLAEDLAQESYMRLLRAKLEPGSGYDRRRSYLFRIATNLVTDHYRRGRRDIAMPDDLPGPADAGTGEDVQRALRQVSAQDRALLWLAYVEALSHREIAEVLDVREVSIRGMLFRARGRFSAILEKKGLRP